MNINDIKKGLECCLKPTVDYCDKCPYDNSKKWLDCDIDQMHQDALNLINELEKENELLRSMKNDQS